jgi:hypothetical protein
MLYVSAFFETEVSSYLCRIIDPQFICLLKNVVFCDVAPYRYCVNRLFGGKYRLHLQGRKNPRARKQREQPPVHAGFSETSVHTRLTRRQIPEDGIVHSYSCENLKSYICLLFLNGYIR